VTTQLKKLQKLKKLKSCGEHLKID
jgi:hypothetical protein